MWSPARLAYALVSVTLRTESYQVLSFGRAEPKVRLRKNYLDITETSTYNVKSKRLGFSGRLDRDIASSIESAV